MKKLFLLLVVLFTISCSNSFIVDDLSKESNHEPDCFYQTVSDNRGNFRDPSKKWSISQRHNLTYKFANDLTTNGISNSDMRKAFKEAAQEWMNVVGVEFREVSSNPLFEVKSVIDTDDSYQAYSFFPNETPYFSDDKVLTLRIYKTNIENKNKYNTYDKMVGLFIHELGHSLGLAHEHQRDESTNTYGQTYYGTPYGLYDKNSIMHYRNSPYTGGFSAGDIAAINALYNEEYLVLYKHANYQGSKYFLTPGNKKNLSLISNNEVSSIKAYTKRKYTLYSGKSGSGSRVSLSGNISYLGKYNFNDKTSSITLPKEYLIAYEHSNYRGRSITINLESDKYYNLNSLNNNISSIKAFTNKDYNLYDKISGEGIYVVLNGDVANLQDYGFNDLTSSVAIWSEEVKKDWSITFMKPGTGFTGGPEIRTYGYSEYIYRDIKPTNLLDPSWVIIEGDFIATMYENIHQDSFTVLYKGTTTVPNIGFDKSIDFVRLSSPERLGEQYTILYEDKNYSGNYRVIPKHWYVKARKDSSLEYKMKDWFDFDNRTSSLRTFGTRVELYDTTSTSSKKRGITGNVNLGSYGMDNKTSMVKFLKEYSY